MSEPNGRGVHQTLRPSRSMSSCTSPPEFAELRKKFRSFVIPATIAFMSWYLLYVVMSNWAHDFMSTKVVGNINVALVFGLLQFVSTFLIAWLYGRYMSTQRRPARPRARAALRRRGSAAGRCDAMSSETLSTDPLPGRRRDHDRHHLLGQPATPRARPTTTPAAARSAASRTAWPSPATTCRAASFLGISGRDRARRVRRLPLLDRLPGGLAGRPAAGRRAAAELRSLHDGRPARLPDAAAPGAHRGGDLDRRRLDLLPARADGRRGRAGHPAARRRRRVGASGSRSSSSAC